MAAGDLSLNGDAVDAQRRLHELALRAGGPFLAVGQRLDEQGDVELFIFGEAYALATLPDEVNGFAVRKWCRSLQQD